MSNFSNRIDKSSPVPIYFQIAEAIRWQISTGQLSSGDELPPTREAATLWNANRHTIRRAYQELVNQGLVEPRGTSRMVVTEQQPATTDGQLREFILQTCEKARTSFGLSPREFAKIIQTQKNVAKDKINIVECNHYQCFDLKRQLERRFNVVADEFLLESEGEPGPGPIVGTLFHSNEICARWPNRRNQIHFGGLYVDPNLADRVYRCCAEGTRIRDVVVFSERHETDSYNLATDLQMALNNKSVKISPSKPQHSVSGLLRQGKVVAVAPWNWDAIGQKAQQHARCFLLQYRFDPVDLESIGERFGLTLRHSQPN